MKLRKRTAKGVSGVVLVYALGVASIIGAALIGYLTLVSNEGHSTQRSQAWNSCIAVVEAGIEEALAHLNSAGVTNLGTESWVLSGSYYEYECFWYASATWNCASAYRPLAFHQFALIRVRKYVVVTYAGA